MGATIKFQPAQKYKVDKEGKYVLDKKGCKIAIDQYKGTTFEEMVDFLKENGSTEDKAEFKVACKTKKVYEIVIGKRGGEYKVWKGETQSCEEINVLYAKEWFFKKYAPEYLPKKTDKTNKNKSMEDLLAEL